MNARTATLLFVLCAGCGDDSTGNMHTRNPDAMLQFANEDLAVPSLADLAGPVEDMASAPGDFAFNEDAGSNLPSDMMRAPPPDGGVGGCGLRINEVMVGTTQSSSAEFVEIYNSCPTSLKLHNWSMDYRASNNNGTTIVPDLATNITGGSIPGKGYLVYGGSKLPSSQRNALLNNGLSDTNGAGVALIDPNGNIVDSVAWGKVVSYHNFIEGTPAPQPALAASPGNSIARFPDGQDTDDNSADFHPTTTPTPRAANQIN
jgi:hypothetical protein